MGKTKGVKTDNGKYASIWSKECYENGFHCLRCGKKLWSEQKHEFTEHVIFQKLGGREYGICSCGERAVVIQENYSGEQKSLNWEEQLNKDHAAEVASLEREIQILKASRAETYKKAEELQKVADARGVRITTLNNKINDLMAEIDKLKIKRERDALELTGLRAEVKRLKEGTP